MKHLLALFFVTIICPLWVFSSDLDGHLAYQKECQDFLNFMTTYTSFDADIFTKTSSGCSGFTFLVKIKENSQIPKRPSGIVLKWCDKQFVDNEVCCGNIMSKLGEKAPAYYVFEDTKCKSLIVSAHKKAVKEFPAMASGSEKFKLLAMNMCPGDSLQHALTEADCFSKLSRLDNKGFKNIYYNLGKTALYDLIIGNNDRFFRFDFHSQNFKEHFNAGNILVRISDAKNYNKDNPGHSEFCDVFVIDNATDTSFCLKKSKADDDDNFSFFGLFGDEDEANSADNNNDDSSPLTNDSNNINDKIQLYIAEARKLIEDPSLFSELIMSSSSELTNKIISELEKRQRTEVFSRIECNFSIKRGILDAINIVKNSSLNSGDSSLFDDSPLSNSLKEIFCSLTEIINDQKN